MQKKRWWEVFGSYGLEFEKALSDYDKLNKKTQLFGVLMKLELDMYNGDFIQFFCNWGYSAYLLAINGLEDMGALETKHLLSNSFCQGVLSNLGKKITQGSISPCII